MQIDGVRVASADQCQYDATTRAGEPLKKPTRFMTNSTHLAEALSRKCPGRGGVCSRGQVHALCNGQRAKDGAIYPFELCRAILTGFRNQMIADGRLKAGSVGLNCVMLDGGDARAVEEHYVAGDHYGNVLKFTIQSDERFIDDLSGQPLDPVLCRAARKLEMDFVRDKGLWVKRSIRECWEKTGKPPVTVRWVETNKGDDINPNIRSRLVARQIRGPGQDPVFAPTPPLEALRTVLSLAATDLPGRPKRCRDPKSEKRCQVSFVDISRAYFNAPTDPKDPCYVALPGEDEDFGKDLCGLLLRHMYGTQKAAEGWQCEYSSFLVSVGFKQGVACPCIFVHPERDVVVTVHGDDFTAVGPKDSLDWYEKTLETKYDLKKGGRLGPGPKDDREATCLNRIIRWCDDGLEYEADPRQVEKLVEELELVGCNPCVSPGVKALAEQHAEDKPLDASLFTRYRALAARANYLSADRPDCQYAAKEICRFMSTPTELSMAALKRFGRYLLGRPRLVFRYVFQSADCIDCYSDTDWAGCAKTRKSTSGGVIVLGEHILKTYSSTQPTISLSSGEAEFYGVVKAAGSVLGQQSLFADLGVALSVRVWTDSSAAIGICSRQGLGKLRHIDTQALWIQERVRTKNIILKKVRGDVNPADLLTKHISGKDKIDQLVSLYGLIFMGGRAKSAPLLKKTVESIESNVVYNIPCSGRHICVLKEIDLGGDVIVPEADAHDPSRWPHSYSEAQQATMFPTAVAAPEVDPPSAEELLEHTRLHQRWAAVRMSVTRG